MQIQIHSDRNIQGHQGLSAHVSDAVEKGLGRLGEHVSRVEVHLSDENGRKSSGDDKRCMMEARLERHQPVAVTHHAATVDQAVTGAIGKLSRLIENTLGKKLAQRTRRTDPPPVGSSDDEPS